MALTSEKDYAGLLLSEAIPADQKPRLLSDYLEWYARFGRALGMGRRGSETMGLRHLLAAVPPEKRSALQEVLDRIRTPDVSRRVAMGEASRMPV